MTETFDLRAAIGNACFAFRGYNVTNLGRTLELLEHPVYGSTVEAVLREGSEIASETLGRRVDLGARVRARRETTDLTTYAEDVALIVAVEQAQLRTLEKFFGIALRQGKLAFGYSLGELSALIATGTFEMQHLLPAPVALADDCAALAHDVTMGVLFSRGPALSRAAVKRLCLEISQEGKGTIDVSTHLSPNSMLVLGQGETIDRFQLAMETALPKPTYLRRNQHRWPPLHTPITWQRAIPNRAAVLLQRSPGGLRAPALRLLSGVTGKASYAELNSRELLHRWVDHPQRLWDVIYEVLAAGANIVVHVGPGPNLIPATFQRIATDVRAQLAGYLPGRFGANAVAHLVRRPWLAKFLPSSAALLRAPFVKQVVLEDWLLEER